MVNIIPQTDKSTRGRYWITEAAGVFWLYDPGQEAWKYKRPVMMNEVGRNIAGLWIGGADEEQIASELSLRYGVDSGTILVDIRNFVNELSTKGY